MPEIKLENKCCLSCQHFLINRQFNKNGYEETLVSEEDHGICSDKKHQNQNLPVLFSCSHYQRWNMIDVEIAKLKNLKAVRQDNSSYLSQDIHKVEEANRKIEQESLQEEEKKEAIDINRNKAIDNEENTGNPNAPSEAPKEEKKQGNRFGRTGITFLVAFIALAIFLLMLIPSILSSIWADGGSVSNFNTVFLIAYASFVVFILLVALIKLKTTKKK